MNSNKVDSSSLASVATSGDYDDLSDKPIFSDNHNLTQYSFKLKNRDSNSYYKALMSLQTGDNPMKYGLYLIFVKTGSTNPSVIVSKLAGTSNAPTFTGTVSSDNTLTLTASETIYGGIDVYMH